MYKKIIQPQLDMVFSHVSSGGSLEELAARFGITLAGLEQLVRRHAPLARTIENAAGCRRARDDDAVENALFQRAVGFEQPDGKFSPPDVRAAMFWLKNRRPELWDEKNRNNNGLNIELSELEEGL